MRRIDSANNWPGLSDLACEIKGTKTKWHSTTQNLVVKTLRHQYSSLDLDLPQGFENLDSSAVTTVTTGHQLQLFGGAAFLHYKTITAIRKARQLSTPESPVIPVFWLASEDHDFEEIRCVYGQSSKHCWTTNSGLKLVGSLSLEGVKEAFESWSGDMEFDLEEIKSVLNLSIERDENYGQFFIRLMHLWYGDLGLVVIDASNKKLKEHFATIMSKELIGEGVNSFVQPGPIKPREINLFYTPEGGSRVGVINSNDGPVSNGVAVTMDKPELLSPSVLLRPLYQESLLPNSHVILGPSELKYWQQLPDVFEKNAINMPTLFLRDHVLVSEKADYEVLAGLGWELKKGWWSIDDFIRVLIEKSIEKGFGLKLEDLKNDEKLLQMLEAFQIDLGSELKSDEVTPRVKSKIRKTAIKKVKRHLKGLLADEIGNVTRAHSKVMNGIIPQDRWSNFHVLSESVGGFKKLRDKLLETTGAEGPVMQVIIAL